MSDLTCRHCERPVAVPASKCPWCNQVIMVICSSCKAYTDDQESHCQQCGAVLQPDQKQHLVLQAHHPELARMVEDKMQAKLVASAVVVAHHTDFFYSSEGHQTVLAKLFGSGQERRAVTAGVLFSAYAYLAQEGYCAVRVRGEKEGEAATSVTRLRPWDGQNSIEKALAEQVGRALTTREVTEKALRELMNFRVRPVPVNELAPMRSRLKLRPVDTVQSIKMRSTPDRSAMAAVDQLARVTTLPDHDSVEACRSTYRHLAAFVDQAPDRARLLASELMLVLRELEAYT